MSGNVVPHCAGSATGDAWMEDIIVTWAGFPRAVVTQNRIKILN